MRSLKCACGSRYCTDSVPRSSDGSACNRAAIRSYNRMVKRSMKRAEERLWRRDVAEDLTSA